MTTTNCFVSALFFAFLADILCACLIFLKIRRKTGKNITQRGSVFLFYPTCLNKKGGLLLKISHFKKNIGAEYQ
jgi:hypothetical protein